ncbi:hypothetical protein DAY19_03300 [Halobacteriovorax vibrionivorans]|uniref:Peptidase S74 domain-containing protein n=1 Tax=Halobacteriovorax vibrionivorans TaxID=2152716 RepID=A0ABY0IJK3_9BACT|nr:MULTISPECIES: tail fiber domain-containing protein [Halobacteriovorax]RZF22812.1 hypothetical protein DAY19_03300 [Halobacteriovorax vibrionivorans]TGD47398.1 hypothetical protein EP118_08750 [Halobacteriovorax sp. Y22]
MNYKKRNNEFGFTLVEIMVAAGLLGVLSVAVVNIMGNINKTSKRASQVFNVQQEKQRISRFLSDKDSCQQTLNGVNFGPQPNFTTTDTLTEIRDKDGNAVISVGDELGSQADIITVDSMQIMKDADSTPDDFPASGGVTHYKFEATMAVIFLKGRAGADADVVKRSSYGGATIPARFKVTVITNAAGDLQSCHGAQDEYIDAACVALGGHLDINGDCAEVRLITEAAGTTPASPTYSAIIGSSTAVPVGANNTPRVPLIVTRDNGVTGLRFDERTIQSDDGSATSLLRVNPYGRVEISGVGYTDIANGNPASAALKIMGSGSSYLAFDSNEIQASNAGVATSLMLNPYGSYVMVGQSGQTSHFRVYGNIQVGDPGSPVTTRQITMYDGSYINFLSDESVKDEVAVLDGVLDKLDEIRGVSFVWKDTGRKDIGYIAQDLEKVFPEVVERDEATGLLNVQYTKMPAINTAAIKELRAENQELKFRVNLLMKALCEGEDAYKYEDVCALPLAPLE